MINGHTKYKDIVMRDSKEQNQVIAITRFRVRSLFQGSFLAPGKHLLCFSIESNLIKKGNRI